MKTKKPRSRGHREELRRAINREIVYPLMLLRQAVNDVAAANDEFKGKIDRVIRLLDADKIVSGALRHIHDRLSTSQLLSIRLRPPPNGER